MGLVESPCCCMWLDMPQRGPDGPKEDMISSMYR